MNGFEAIIGYEKEKIELMRLCDVMNNKDKYSALGVEMPRAILIYGEPGLGKTLMAKTLIEASGRQFFSCKKNRTNGVFVDKIRETFENAISNQPSIVFLDDMDKFAEDNLREDSNKEEFVTIQSCLEDLIGKDVFVVATANDIYNIPNSLLREGRFGKQIKVEIPCYEDLIKIVAHFLKKKSVSDDVSAEFVASFLTGKSCAFLETVINEAGIYAGYENQTLINKKHIIDAVMILSTKNLPSKGMSAKEKQMVCYHEAGHATAAILLGKKIALLTSKKHGDVGGFCSTYEYSEENHTFEEFKNEIIILLSGRASTEITLNTIDLGAESDITKACQLTRYYIEKLAIKGFSFIYDSNPYQEKQPTKRNEAITEKVSETIDDLYKETMALLIKHKELLKSISMALLEREILLWDDICEIARKHAS